MTKKLILSTFLALAGCGEPRPPAPSAEQNDQLNEAEDMLNEEAGQTPDSDAAAAPAT